MKIATWNVNGIRAREQQFLDWIVRDKPDVVCLQEIKAAPEQVPAALCELPGYWCYWHGAGGYSGVALHVRRGTFPEKPEFSHPEFDHETRIVTARMPGLENGITVASVYVPNGGKDFPAKMRFLQSMRAWSGAKRAAGETVVICGDLNIARTDMDVHPKERKVVTGQLPEERAILEGIIDSGYPDLGRQLDPDNDGLFTWWAPWRNMKERNIGWRLDYVLAAEPLARHVQSCVVRKEIGTSDHAPVLAEFQGPGVPMPDPSAPDPAPPAPRETEPPGSQIKISL